ncbi:unnamed protein product [Eruca vesicaria subsp. sativa]|uniref:Uncharacterized protein n=1 Tax=Eruca vesicaria subsp. sativa TaxID=29727 RepID=A0ABC8LPK0_ERUVS|nr:unnamed protein product [Eruca vesicaria subsp. sativa]
MEKPPPPDSLSSYSEVSYYVRNKIELCLQNYMSLERTANYLEKNHQISKTLTHLVWEQLLKQNPVFFVNFDLRRKTALHLKTVNDLLTKQAVLMFENGLLDISDASTSVRSLLRQKHPERIHVLETLVAQSQSTYAHQDQVLNPASFAMPYANGISVAQWQIPNEQLNEHLYATNLPLPATNAIAVMRMPIPYDQQDQHLYTASLPLPTANGPSNNSLGAPTFPPVDTDDLSLLLNDPACKEKTPPYSLSFSLH